MDWFTISRFDSNSNSDSHGLTWNSFETKTKDSNSNSHSLYSELISFEFRFKFSCSNIMIPLVFSIFQEGGCIYDLVQIMSNLKCLKWRGSNRRWRTPSDIWWKPVFMIPYERQASTKRLLHLKSIIVQNAFALSLPLLVMKVFPASLKTLSDATCSFNFSQSFLNSAVEISAVHIHKSVNNSGNEFPFSQED